MEEREYKRRIRQEKEKLRDEEIFTSDKYIQMLRSVAKEITDGQFDRVVMSREPAAGYLGQCNGESVVINIENEITQSFATKELKSDSIVGILGHECGHYNYSDCALFRKYQEGILEGIWYPHPPVAETGREEEYLAEMEKHFQEKNKAALAIICEVAGQVQNLLEDVYVEMRMCRKYPGSIRRGILQNRRRNGERIPSLRRQIAMQYEELSIMVNLIAQYALFGEINNWDGYQGKFLDILEQVKPVVDQAANNTEGSSLFAAANQILLKIWEIFREAIREIEGEKSRQEEKTQEDGQPEEDEPDKQGDSADQGTNEQSGSEGQGTNSQNGPEGQDGQTGTDGDSPGEMSAAQEMIHRFLSQTPRFLRQDLQEETKDSHAQERAERENRPRGMETKDREKYSQENETAMPEKAIEVDAKLYDLIAEMAKEKAMAQMSWETGKELRKQLNEMSFQSGHCEVKKVLKRSSAILDSTGELYELYKPQVKKVMKRLEAHVYPVLKKQETRAEHKLWMGRRLDTRNVANPLGNVFEKKNQEGQNPSAALAVLVDMSGSMIGQRIEYAKFTALCLYEFCKKARLPVTIYGHHTDGHSHQRLEEETVFLHSLAEYIPEADDPYRILQMQPAGCNRDGTALIFVGNKLLERKEKHKILAIISDGLPNATCYCGEDAERDLMQIKKELARKGVTFLAAAIGADREAIKRIYQEAFLDISDMDKLPVLLAKQIIRHIRRC